MIEFVNFLVTTDPKPIMDWALVVLFSILTVLVTILGGSLAVKEVAEMWGFGKWL